LIKNLPTVWEKISENRRGGAFFDSHCTAKRKYCGRGLVDSYDNRPGNEVGLFYSAPGPTWGYNQHKDSMRKQTWMINSRIIRTAIMAVKKKYTGWS